MRVLNDSYEKLTTELEKAGTDIIHLSDPHQILHYYQQEYGSQKIKPASGRGNGTEAWKVQITRDISRATGQREDTVARRFRGTRVNLNKPTKKTLAEYKKLGQQLPGTRVPRKDLAGKKAKVNIKGDVKISDDERPRKMEATLTGRQMSALRRGDLGAFFEAYKINPGAVESINISRITVDYL